MKKTDEEYNFLEDAFRDEPKAGPRRESKGDEGDWLDAAFREDAPIQPKMSGKAKAAIVVAIVLAIALLALLGVESLSALNAFVSAAALS